MQVLHKCDNPICSNPEHLFLGTQKDNCEDCVKKGRNVFGTRNGSAKLTEKDIIDIRNDSRLQREIGQSYGVSQLHISRIKRRLNWKHI
jgi:uncharacterized protein YerC